LTARAPFDQLGLAARRGKGKEGSMAGKRITRVGFIGLGAMGRPMALNLLKAGFGVTVNSRSRGPVEALLAEGAREAATPREVAQRSEVVITMLPATLDVEAICLGANGIVEAGAHTEGFSRTFPLTVVDMSTISPKASRAIGEALKEAGIDFLEAPVSGGEVGAQAGSLSIMCGGPDGVFELVEPLFQAMGQSYVRMGYWGQGQTTKLANNIIAAITIESIAEALVLGVKAGLDPAKMYEAIKGGAAACWSLDHKAPMMWSRDFNPGFRVRLHLKDLNLALEAGEELNVPLPVTRQVRDMLQQLVDEGHGDEDNGALVKVIEKLAGVKVRRPTGY
jgi:2-hydroxy-3-oxopropionate reductase